MAPVALVIPEGVVVDLPLVILGAKFQAFEGLVRAKAFGETGIAIAHKLPVLVQIAANRINSLHRPTIHFHQFGAKDLPEGRQLRLATGYRDPLVPLRISGLHRQISDRPPDICVDLLSLRHRHLNLYSLAPQSIFGACRRAILAATAPPARSVKPQPG